MASTLNLNSALSIFEEKNKKKYQCSKGHRWEAIGVVSIALPESGIEIRICPFCLTDFLDQNLGSVTESE